MWAYCDSRNTAPRCCAELELQAGSRHRHSQQGDSWASYRGGTFQGQPVAAKGFPHSYSVYSAVEEECSSRSWAEAAAPYVDQVGLG